MRLAILLAMVFCVFTIHANETLSDLTQWIENKPLEAEKKSEQDLSIRGEVRIEYQNSHETKNGIIQRAPIGKNSAPIHGYDLEVNLMLDYRTEQFWSAIKLEFDNTMGAREGSSNALCLEKAYFGARVLQGMTYTLDVELGRRPLNNIVVSKLQFSSVFDGILLCLNKETPNKGTYYAKTAVFLLSDKSGRYGQVIELGAKDIYQTGFEAIYSLINWKKSLFAEEQNEYNFVISQLSLAKVFHPRFFRNSVKPYVGILVNMAAKKNDQSPKKKNSLGVYSGVSLGKITKKGDISFDANYQYLQALAVPQFDASGIGVGNAAKVDFNHSTCTEAVGKTNYKGYRFELQYALTDNITIFQSYQSAKRLDPSIGPKMKFKQYEIEMIYKF